MMTFRYDINGLRAIAVIAVVLFHFNPAWVPGGFAGVDVFFVISGFLMTGIIFRGLENDSFNLFKFYVARANRIIPALAVLCLVLLVFGWFYLTPLDYRPLGKHVASSMGFLSNVIYWRESGYFDAASHEKWLLHTWSLSVEWQFYIIYPIVLIALKRFLSLDTLKRLIVISSALGFVFSVIATVKWPNAAYYILPTRAWEMMIGGVAFLYPLNLSERRKKAIEIAGLLLILSSYAFISSETPWPGHFALLPVFGAYLMIVANQQSSVITNNAIFQYLGKWSYSIYLWHWPVVVLGLYLRTPDWSLYGLPLSVILGFASFKFIEGVKFKTFSKWLELLKAKPAYMSLILGLGGTFVFASDGILERPSGDKYSLYKSAYSAVGDWNYPSPNKSINGLNVRFIEGSSDKNILFMGASHIEQTYPFVLSLEQKYNVYYLTVGGCLVTPVYSNPKWSCGNLQEYKKLLSKISFDKIVTSFYAFDGYLPKDEELKSLEVEKRISEYRVFLSDIRKHTKDIYLITGEPRGEEFDPVLSTRFDLDGFVLEDRVRRSYELHEYALSKIPEIKDVYVIDPINYLCSNGMCKTVSDNGEFFYKDKNHMRPLYAINNLSYLLPIFD